MTVLVPFVPNNNSSPPFYSIFTLDNISYNGAVTWNIAGQRWYLSLTDQSGNNIWTGAMIGSPLGYDLYLAPGIFTTSTLLYREDTGNFEQNP
jgi:hypothetical protein